jgi:hypothetical protein
MFDPSVWFVGGGAEHSPEIARAMLYASSGGSEGVGAPGDLKVATLATPGTSIRVLPGGALILNRSPGGSQQTYATRSPSATNVAIAATGSSGGRSDLIVARIEDPTVDSQWDAPSDPTAGPYGFPRVIPNVPAGTRRLQDIAAYAGHSAVTLARLDIPPSTGTITAGMIVDLRRLANPRVTREITTVAATGSNGGVLASTDYVPWPTVPQQLVIPSWATRLVALVDVNGMQQSGGNVYAFHRLQLSSGSTAILGPEVITDADAPSTSGKQRQNLRIPIAVDIPAALRGTTQALTVMSKRQNSDVGRLNLYASSQLIVDTQFTETLG